MLGGGHPVEQLPELEPLIPKGRLGEFALDHGEAGGLPQVVAEEDGLQRERGLRALMAGDFCVEGRDGFGDNGGLVVKVVHVLEQVGSLGEAGFEALGGLELHHDALLDGGLLSLVDDRFSLLERHDEVSVLFHLALGDFEPLLPVLGDDLRHKFLLNLIERRLTAITVEHELDHAHVVARGHLAEAGQSVPFLGEDMLGGDGLQRVGGKGQVHLVAGLAWKIDGELAEDSVDRGDAPEAPALVRAVAALHQCQ